METTFANRLVRYLALQEHEDVHKDKTQHDGVHDRTIRGKERETGVQAVDHQSGQHNGHAAVAGDAQRQQGDEGRTADSVVGRLRRRNALHRTVAELFRVFGHILRSVVGEPRGLRRTVPGTIPTQEPMIEPISTGRNIRLYSSFCDFAVIIADFSGVKVQLIPLQLCLANDFHQCEQTDEGNGKVKTQIQTGEYQM